MTKAIGFLFALVCCNAGAAEYRQQGHLSLTLSTYAVHMAAGREPLQDILGAGVAYRLRPRVELLAGAFENSYDRTSAYAMASYWPDPRVFLAAGYLDGYSRTPVGFAFGFEFRPVRIVAGNGSLSLWLTFGLRN